jgi:hypothetical protein
MKFNHNKKRNTAFIYEILISQLSRASMYKDENKRKNTMSIMKEFYSKGKLLKNELEIYNSLDSIADLPKETREKVLKEAKRQFTSLDRRQIFNEQTRLINKINKKLGKEAWSNYIASYKKYATINQVLSVSNDPRKQVLAEGKLLESLVTKQDKNSFPKVNNLAVKTFIEKFNLEYGEQLNESQKDFLKKYIMSYLDDGLEFKIFLYEEVDRLKSSLTESAQKGSDGQKNKINKILEKISAYSERKLDKSLIFEVMQIQALARELKNGDIN